MTTEDVQFHDDNQPVLAHPSLPFVNDSQASRRPVEHLASDYALAV